jgi:hypothetical protein
MGTRKRRAKGRKKAAPVIDPFWRWICGLWDAPPVKARSKRRTRG